MLSGSMRTLLIVLGFQAVPYIGTSRNITDSRAGAGSKFKVNTEPEPWNNGKEVPRWGVAEIQKMSPSTTGRCK